MAKEIIVPWDAKPDYDDWGPDGFWDLGTWVAWHKGLVKKYGRTKDDKGYEVADKIWLNAWKKQSIGSSPLLAITQPSRFKDEADYIKKFPLLYQYSGLKQTSETFNPIDTSYKATMAAQNIAESAIDVTSSAADAAAMTAKVLKYAIPAVVVVGLTFASIYVYKNYIKGQPAS